MELNSTRLTNSQIIFVAAMSFYFVGLLFPTVRVSNIAIGVLIILSLIHLRADHYKIISRNKFSLSLLALFVLQLVALSYTSNMKDALMILEKRICFVFFPLVFLPYMTRHVGIKSTIIKWLGILTMASSILLLVIASIRKYVFGYEHAFAFESFRHFEGFSPIHYVYYALIFICGFFFFLDAFFEIIRSRKFGIVALLAIFLYAAWIVVLVASKTGILIFIVATIIFLFLKLGNKKIVAIAALALVASIGIFLAFNDTTRNRFVGLNDNIDVLKQEVLVDEFKATGLNMRMLFWKIQLKHLVEDKKIFFGVGTGDAQDYIDQLYNMKEYELWGYIGWDSHNQWVFTLVQLGIPGVLLLLWIYVLGFKTALRKNDAPLLIFLVITLAFSFSESILELNKGILFFTCLYTLMTIPYAYGKTGEEAVSR